MTHRLLTVTFALWLGGLGCVLGCAPGVFAADGLTAVDKTGASAVASHSEHACCQAAVGKGSEQPGRKAASLEQHRLVTILQCCPLAGQTIDVTRKSLVNAGAAPAFTTRVSFAPTAFLTVSSFRHQAQLPDRGGTYLRCCVFLI